MVSAPVRAARAATTLESTPPDMATTIRRFASGSGNWNWGCMAAHIIVRAAAFQRDSTPGAAKRRFTPASLPDLILFSLPPFTWILVSFGQAGSNPPMPDPSVGRMRRSGRCCAPLRRRSRRPARPRGRWPGSCGGRMRRATGSRIWPKCSRHVRAA